MQAPVVTVYLREKYGDAPVETPLWFTVVKGRFVFLV
jgi:hypothetical protein